MATEIKGYVRPVNPEKDSDALFDVCKKTVGPALRTGTPNLIAPYIWNVPYIRMCQDYCFAVDNGDGNAVGYVICAPDTPTYVRRFAEEYIPVLESLDPILKKPAMDPPADWGKDLALGVLQCLYTPEHMLNSDYPRLLEEYPAHLHIDILPDFQRKGFGKKLMEALWTRLREDKIPGVHLVMEGGNTEALKFYLAIGFSKFDDVVNGGKSGETGKDKNGNLWMVKKL
ncbi:hypothetical protein H072_11431 [Dactylellina haptotyla CBS 200.50]|uniref:N-acetyltransferase domain-containing protein n=1 Tax=Dactylellina haptotyla (strain CBS 200.50) TaxID=1284197 RepID=S8B7S4_DACHA|nr:hypothetical protein H072_11431 [Dactylellina haptotyla CBS 200.50]